MLKTSKIENSKSPIPMSYRYSSDYYPFGSSLPTRSWSDASRAYRYGFNGKEKDSETASDKYDFGARIYDGRLGRWLSVDPLMKKYPDQSSYVFCLNSVLIFKDIDGRDVVFTVNDKGKMPPATHCLAEIGTTSVTNPEVVIFYNTATGLYDIIVNVLVSYTSNLTDLEAINPGLTIFAKVHEGVHVSRIRNATFSNYGLNSNFLVNYFGFTEVFTGRADEVLNQFISKGRTLVNDAVIKNNIKIDKEYADKINTATANGDFNEVERLKEECEMKKLSFSQDLNSKLEAEINNIKSQLNEMLITDINTMNSHSNFQDQTGAKEGINNETLRILEALGEKNAADIQDGLVPVFNVKREEMINCE